MSQDKAAEIIDFNPLNEAAPALAETQKAGDFLKAAREAAGLSRATVSANIKVKIEHLEAIESNRPDLLPPTPYAVGFVKVFAAFLGLDADAVAARFKSDIAAAAPASLEEAREDAAPAPHIGEGARIVSIFGIVAILIFVGWIVLQVTAHKTPADAPEPRVRLTETAPPVPRPALMRPAPAPVIETPEPVAVEADEPATPVAAPVPAPADTSTPIIEEPAPAVEEPPVVETAVEEIAAPIAEAPPQPEPEEILEAPAPVIEETTLPVLAPPVSTPSLTAPVVAPATEPDPAQQEVVVAARLTRSAAPKYPNRCDRGAAQVETVTVIFDVTAAGRTANPRVVDSSNACFENAAVRAIGRWRFDPKTVDGAPRPDLGKRATLNFRQ